MLLFHTQIVVVALSQAIQPWNKDSSPIIEPGQIKKRHKMMIAHFSDLPVWYFSDAFKQNESTH